MHALERYVAKLPDGAMWLYGSWLKDFIGRALLPYVNLVPGRGVLIQRSNRATVISFSGTGSGRTLPVPFEVTIGGAPLDGTTPGDNTFVVRPGTINNLLPTNIAAQHSFSATASSQYVKLTVATDGKQVTSCVLSTTTSPPVPPQCTLGSPPTSFSVPLALIVNGSAVYQIVQQNLMAVMSLCKQTDRTNPPAGSSPWDNWWTWTVGSEVES